MAQIIDEIIASGRVLLIPAFAVGRTQQIVYMINTLIRQGRIPNIDIHVDSPMAVKATNIYRNYRKYHQLGSVEELGGIDFLAGDNVYLHRGRQASKGLNKLNGPAVIISASGMMTGGRIMHHLISRLPKENTTLALVGFMAQGTLGRKISEGETSVYIHKSLVEIKAKVIWMAGLSGHADYYEIDHWLEPVEESPRKIYVTHGEREESEAMAAYLKKNRNWNCVIPEMDQVVEL